MISPLRWWQEKNLRNRILEAHQQNIHPGPIANLEFVGILFVVEDLDSVKKIRNFIHHLEVHRLRPIHLGYIPRRIDARVDYGYLHYGRQDISWKGIPGGKDIVQFRRRQFSYLLNLDRTDELTMHYLCSSIPARFKLSLGSSFSELYDVNLSADPNLPFEEILEKTLDIFTKTCLKT